MAFPRETGSNNNTAQFQQKEKRSSLLVLYVRGIIFYDRTKEREGERDDVQPEALKCAVGADPGALKEKTLIKLNCLLFFTVPRYSLQLSGPQRAARNKPEK